MSSNQSGDGRPPPMDIPTTRSAPIDIPYPSSEARARAQTMRDRARNIGTFTDTSNELENPGETPNPEEYFLRYHYGTRADRVSLRAGGCSPPNSIAPRPLLTAPRLDLAGPVAEARSRSRAATSFAGYEGRTAICAVTEGRGPNPPVGIAIADIELGRVTMCQVSDTLCYVHTIHKIRMHEPSHILVVPSTTSVERSALCGLLTKEIDGAIVIPVPRNIWCEKTGLKYIQDLAFTDEIEALKVVAAGNYYAVCSLAAALKYVEDGSGSTIEPHTLAIVHEPAEDSMMIDVSSIHSLELLQNAQNPRSKNSLFGLLNHTLTPMGARQLRSSILQPSTKQDLILRRQAAVKELSDFQDLFYGVRNALKQLPDVDKAVSQLIFTSSKTDDGSAMNYENKSMINCILQIKQFVSAVPALYEALTSAKCDILVKTQEQCLPEITRKVLAIINSHIDKDAQFSRTPRERRNQAIYAIKARNNSALDVGRKKYAEQQDHLHKHVGEFNTQYNLSCEIKFDHSRGYYLRLPASDYMEASAAHPGLLINAVHKRSHCECQTITLQKLSKGIKATEDEVLMRSAQAIRSAAGELRAEVPALTRLCGAVGCLDMLASLAHVVTTNDYCRPDISTSGALKKARHPLVEKCIDNFVPSDYYSSEEYSFLLVTGVNMSGKTTFIKTPAMIQIMAQIGSFVPAQTASVPIIKKIFTRMIKDECIEENVSAFSQEMREMDFILRNADTKSLVVIDELGRATSTRDGLGVAIAMAEKLLAIGARVIFATHFYELAEIMQNMPRVVNQHLQTEVRTVGHGEAARLELKMLHTMASGPVAQGDYGLQLARAVGCPQPFLAGALAAADKLRAKAEARARVSEGDAVLRRRALMLNLKETLRQLAVDDPSCALLGRVRDEFVEKLPAIGGGGGGDDNEEQQEEEEGDEEEREEDNDDD